MSHYTHHIDDSGKEPTVIEIKGEPYPEELDPELHRAYELAHKGMRALKVFFEVEDARPGFSWRKEMSDYRALRRALDEYEKMVSGEGGE